MLKLQKHHAYLNEYHKGFPNGSINENKNNKPEIPCFQFNGVHVVSNRQWVAQPISMQFVTDAYTIKQSRWFISTNPSRRYPIVTSELFIKFSLGQSFLIH